MKENQTFGPVLFIDGTRDANGRFAKGHSGNPRGRPPGIPNPNRRLLDFVNCPPKPGVIGRLIDRKPYLLRRFAQQVLPYRHAPLDPLERVGIDRSAVRAPSEIDQLVIRSWAAMAGGEITPAEMLVIIRRLGRQLRRMRQHPG
jgi:hypothetical protein